jgi:4'-phosphopantetheinyl transferase
MINQQHTICNTLAGEEFLVGKCLVFIRSVQSINYELSILNDEEISRSNRFHRSEDKERYLATRYLIREILSSLTNIDPVSIEFGKTQKGKPFLKTNKEIHFSISHSNSRIAIAVSKGYECGCDIEEIDPKKVNNDLIRTHFHPNEISLIENEKRETSFYHCWTRKEALFKAIGTGLPDDLAAIDSTSEEKTFGLSKYHLHTYHLTGEYIFSLVTEGSTAKNITIYQS